MTPSDWPSIAVPSQNGDDYPALRQCERCGRSIDGRRRQARYCGGPCRAVASRARAARQAETLGHEVGVGRLEETAQNRTHEAPAAAVSQPPNSDDARIGRAPNRDAIEHDPHCPYLDHRGRSWRTRDGRLVCGVCHPPADVSLVTGWAS